MKLSPSDKHMFRKAFWLSEFAEAAFPKSFWIKQAVCLIPLGFPTG